MPQQTHYEVLNLDPTASHEQIRERYIALAREAHPDLAKDAGHDWDSANQRFILINEAYNVLKNPSTRRVYDRKLAELTHLGDSSPNSANTTYRYGGEQLKDTLKAAAQHPKHEPQRSRSRGGSDTEQGGLSAEEHKTYLRNHERYRRALESRDMRIFAHHTGQELVRRQALEALNSDSVELARRMLGHILSVA